MESKEETYVKPDQELKQRIVEKPEETEETKEKIQKGEGEEEDDDEYEYVEVPIVNYYVVALVGAILLILAIVLLNLNNPYSQKMKTIIINDIVGFKNQFFMPKVYKYAVIAFIVFQVVDRIYNLISPPDAKNSSNDDLRELVDLSAINAFLIAGIAVPIFEEIMFRKIMFRFIYMFSKPLAYIISSVVFSYYHFEFKWENLKKELFRFPLYTFAGLLFAYVYEYTGFSLLTSIIAHCLNNSFTVILGLFGVLK